jgi:hypothetical protein
MKNSVATVAVIVEMSVREVGAEATTVVETTARDVAVEATTVEALAVDAGQPIEASDSVQFFNDTARFAPQSFSSFRPPRQAVATVPTVATDDVPLPMPAFDAPLNGPSTSSISCLAVPPSNCLWIAFPLPAC